MTKLFFSEHILKFPTKFDLANCHSIKPKTREYLRRRNLYYFPCDFLQPHLSVQLHRWVRLTLDTPIFVSESIRYETVYACEGKTLKIECKEGELIKLIRANYGRFSITICNDHGNTDWSVNCMSPKSLRVLHNM